jgi:hypothetical protein
MDDSVGKLEDLLLDFHVHPNGHQLIVRHYVHQLHVGALTGDVEVGE